VFPSVGRNRSHVAPGRGSISRLSVVQHGAMDHQARVVALFDRLAAEYDTFGVEFFKPIAAGLVDELAPQTGERAVDVGCGRGAVLFQLAARLGPTGIAVGVDLSPKMVAAAAADAARAGIAVEVRLGDAMSPDLPAASFDVVAASLVLFFLPDPLSALRAWRDLLVPRGRLGVSTFGPYSERWREEVDATLREFAPPESTDARTTGGGGPFASDEAMEELVRAAGWSDVRTATRTVSPRFENADHWYRWSMSVGQRQFWEAIPTDHLPDVKARVFAAVERCRDDQGRIGFDQLVRYTLAVQQP
jgi:ubiquinone/menaquinone biosynthesis C-methylase UbiE